MKQAAEFQLDVVLGGKAVVQETADGDLIIEGYASDYDADRQDEFFEPGAVNEGLKAYMESNPILLYHHKTGHALGQVIEARIDDVGAWVKARIDKPAPGSWAQDVYQKVKRGTIRGFSIGGRFFRHLDRKSGLTKIYKADIHEISVTPYPINPRTLFGVAQKAFPEDLDPRAEQIRKLNEIFELLSQRKVNSHS